MDTEVCHDNNNANHLAKGRCTKRLRPLSPCDVAVTTVTSSCPGAHSKEPGGGGAEDYVSFSSTAISFRSTGKEVEDMTNSLILLAQGKKGENEGGVINNNNTTQSEIATAIAIPAPTKIATAITTSPNVYECKTCNKKFRCFQALGGHRGGHKRPKMTPEEKKALSPPSPPPLLSQLPIFIFEEANQSYVKSSPKIPISLQLGYGNNIGAFNGNKSKIHECSTCGAGFTSGQALGGHMRKHRLTTTANTSTPVVNMEVKPQIVRDIDLNLQAPEEDIQD
ncbi:hypothetical protein RIF29_27599 [Crotalaria pallida]|uniref:C2H2-type domain-containing protein n=1 Tax=Crotalaria pallida TaxID=3830 RepID=A0AAN9ERJ3_CROPI